MSFIFVPKQLYSNYLPIIARIIYIFLICIYKKLLKKHKGPYLHYYLGAICNHNIYSTCVIKKYMDGSKQI